MEFTLNQLLLIGSVLLFVSIIVSKMGYRTGLPALLIFLIVGMAFGVDGVGIKFNNVATAQKIGMVALSVILFSGGMDTKFKDIKPILKEGILLSTLGVLLTTVITGTFIYYVSQTSFQYLNLPFIVAMLLASTMSSTDSASVFNILRTQNIKLKDGLRPMLELESGSNDPMAYMLTVLLIGIVANNGETDGSWSSVLIDFIIQFVVGGGIGFGLGKCSVWVMNKINLSNSSLYSILVLSLAFFSFSLAELLGGNGCLSVYIAGIVCGNCKLPYKKETLTFLNGVTWLMQIAMFLILGLLVNPKEMMMEAIPGTLVGVFMILVARPLSVGFCLIPFKDVNWKQKLFISWVGLRGAAPIIFATYPYLAKVEGSGQIFNIVFFITLLSLLIQGTTISWLAKKLDLEDKTLDEMDDFGIEMPDEINTDLTELVLTEEMLKKGNTLMQIRLPENSLVILVKRDKQFIVPNGQVELLKGDKLLLMSSKDDSE